MNHRLTLVIVLCVCLGALFAQAPLVLPLPQFSNPFYDAFSSNYLGTVAAGRGYTGVAALDNIGGALLNPASVLPDSAQLLLELNFKSAIDAEGYPLVAQYTSPIPFGQVAVGGQLGGDFTAGLIFSVPKSISLQDFSFYINQGMDIVQRFPTYNLQQVTANFGYHQGPLHVGVNLHNQIHFSDDPIFLRTYDRVRDYKYNYRIQPGIIYDYGPVSIGFSAMPPTRFDWDLKYTTYDALMPLWLSGGVHYNRKGINGLLDVEWEQTSAIHDSFSDRYTLKLGVEKNSSPYVYRLGYHYRSNVYRGLIRLGENTGASADTSFFWLDVPTTVSIEDNSQHSLTLGFSYYHKIGSINLSGMQTIIADTPKTQINLSLSLYLSSFKPRRTLVSYE